MDFLNTYFNQGRWGSHLRISPWFQVFLKGKGGKCYRDVIVCSLPTYREEKGENSFPSHRDLSCIWCMLTYNEDLICCPLSVDVSMGRASVELHRRFSSSVVKVSNTKLWLDTAEIQVPTEALLSAKSCENKITCILLPRKMNGAFICSLMILLSEVLRTLKHNHLRLRSSSDSRG